MKTAKLTQNGRSQAVRLPMAFRMSGKEVILEPMEQNWNDFFEALSRFSDDFMEHGRNQPPMRQRDSFLRKSSR